MEGYELRKVNEIALTEGACEVEFETIAHFESVCDAKSFVNQAGTL
jgi:hypothetical protein